MNMFQLSDISFLVSSFSIFGTAYINFIAPSVVLRCPRRTAMGFSETGICRDADYYRFYKNLADVLHEP